jgi:transposase
VIHPDELRRQAGQFDVHQVGFHPIIRAYVQRLGLVELINNLIRGQMLVEPGIIVAGMIQDTFSGRSPLYHLKDFFTDQDTELLLGQPVDANDFCDHNVGRVLDRIYEAGPSRIFGEVARRAAVIFELDTRAGHWDSTSVSVWGEYNTSPDQEGSPLHITFGHSKDGHPDLKQFMISMLCVEHNIPILGDIHDGNSSDKNLNNKLLTRISKNLARHGLGEGAFTYIADAAMVTEENLACFDPVPDAAPLYFVTRLPFTYKETSRVVTEAVQASQWEEIGVQSQSRPTPKRPSASYRAFESKVELYGRTYRAIVIHSSAHDKRRQKRLEKELAEARRKLADSIATSLNNTFFCRADAEAELARIKSLPMPFHRLEGTIEEELQYAPGRPPKQGPRKVVAHLWRIQAEIIDNADTIERKRSEAGCFVLLTNRPKEGKDAQNAEELLRTYKAQDGIERNFGFLKDPLIVNDLFLKKPERIEALGMILLLCLLIWNLMQRQMRRHLEKNKSLIEGWDRRSTDRPTSYMMTTKFRNILILKVGQTRVLKKPLTLTQQAYLKALGLTEAIFIATHPPP